MSLQPFVGALAWIAVSGAAPAFIVALCKWLEPRHAPTLRACYTAFAISTIVMAWFFVTWRVAGTTLNS
jgi:hypothetical protein